VGIFCQIKNSLAYFVKACITIHKSFMALVCGALQLMRDIVAVTYSTNIEFAFRFKFLQKILKKLNKN